MCSKPGFGQLFFKTEYREKGQLTDCHLIEKQILSTSSKPWILPEIEYQEFKIATKLDTVLQLKNKYFIRSIPWMLPVNFFKQSTGRKEKTKIEKEYLRQ